MPAPRALRFSIHWAATTTRSASSGVSGCENRSVCIVIRARFDSHGYVRVDRFLQHEWNADDQNQTEYDLDKVETVCMKVPQQENGYDCGVYVLQYGQVVVTNFADLLLPSSDASAAPASCPEIPREMLSNNLQALLPTDAFSSQDVNMKRIQVAELLAADTKRYQAIRVRQVLGV